jgi:hypothetical protein
MPLIFNDALDDPYVWEQCAEFSGGQVSFAKPATLAPNQAAYLQNVLIHITGQLRKRRGTINLEDGFVAAEGQRIQCLFWYNTVVTEKLLAVANGKFYAYNESTNIWDLYFNAAISNIDEMISVCQLSDMLWWTDTGSGGIRKWDGTVVSTVSGATVPVATILECFTNRLVASGVATVPDGVYFSDLLDGATWNVLNILRVGADGDAVVAIQSWQDSYLLVFKQKSTWLIDVSPTVSVASFPIKNIHRTVGCAAWRSISQVGQDVFFLSHNGVMSVQKQLATSNNAVQVPISLPVQDVIESIRWEYAYKSCSIFYLNHYILFVPINSVEPDTAIVYSDLTKSWVGVWTGVGSVDCIEQPHLGATRLIIGTANGEVRTTQDQLREDEESYDTFTDGFGQLVIPATIPVDLPSAPYVESIVRTRAMEFNDIMSPKTGWYLEAEFLSKDGDITLGVILDGAPKIILDEWTFAASSAILTATLPFYLGVTKWVKKKYPVWHLGQFREIQVEITAPHGNLVLRRIIMSAQLDTVEFNQELELI